MSRLNNICRFSAACALVLCAAAAVIRGAQVSFAASSRGLGTAGAVCFAAGFLLFAAASFFSPNGKSREALSEKPSLPACAAAAAGMFSEFVLRCIDFYSYISKNASPAPNRFIPLALAAVFALLSAVLFAVLAASSRSCGIELPRLAPMRAFPFLWALCCALLAMTDNDFGIRDYDSVLKYLFIVFAMLFFLLFFAQSEKSAAPRALLSAFGFGGFSSALALFCGRAASAAAGAELAYIGCFSPVLLLVGIFMLVTAAGASFKEA